MEIVVKACERNDINFIKRLADTDYQSLAFTVDNKTSFYYACIHKRREILDILIGLRLNINQKCTCRNRPLDIVCMAGDIYMVNALITGGVNVNTVEKNIISPLHYACYGGKLKLGNHNLNFLHDREFNKCVQYAEVYTDIVSALIKAGAEVNVKDYLRRTPLHYACENGLVTTVEVLIASGANLYSRDSKGKTPLHYACLSGNKSLVKVLVDAGADPNIRNKNGESPLHFACKRRYASIVEVLIAAGADVDLRDAYGESSLHFACERKFYVISDILVAAGADRTLKNYRGKTPSYVANPSNTSNKSRLAELIADNTSNSSMLDEYLGVSDTDTDTDNTPLYVANPFNRSRLAELINDNASNKSILDEFLGVSDTDTDTDTDTDAEFDY